MKMTKLRNPQLNQQIVRKCGIICVITVFTLLSFYGQVHKTQPKSGQATVAQPEKDNEANSFYFLTNEQQRDRDLGEINPKVINPLNFKVKNAIRHDRSLLRRSLKKKLRVARRVKRLNRLRNGETNDIPNDNSNKNVHRTADQAIGENQKLRLLKLQSNQNCDTEQCNLSTNSSTKTRLNNSGDSGNKKRQKRSNNKQSNDNQNKQNSSNEDNQQSKTNNNQPTNPVKPTKQDKNNDQNKKNSQNKSTQNDKNKSRTPGKGKHKPEIKAAKIVGGLERSKRNDEDDESEPGEKKEEKSTKKLKVVEEPEEEIGEYEEEIEDESKNKKEDDKKKKEEEEIEDEPKNIKEDDKKKKEEEEIEDEPKKKKEDDKKKKEEEAEAEAEAEEKEKEKEEAEEKKFESEERKEGKSEEQILKDREYNRRLAEAKKRKLQLNDDGEICTPNAYKEFPPDLFGHKLRAKGFILVHILVTCYMFFCLAVVCDNYFLPSLELCSSKLGLSNDVAGATFMAAGSSSPELFAAILGVFIAKSDVGTGTIVGSAIFNVLFVIGLCGVCAASVQLSWWPVARDSSYYCLTVFVLIVVAYDGQISVMESSFMLLLYVGYILTMHFNAKIYQFVLAKINQYTTSEFSEKVMSLDNRTSRGEFANNSANAHYQSFQEEAYNLPNVTNILPPSQHLNKISMFEAACHVIIQHNRLFRPLSRFRAAADLIMIQQRKIKISQYEPNNLGSLSRLDSVESKRKISTMDDVEEYWRRIPNYQEQGPLLFAKWVVVAPLYAVLYYTVPNCKKNTSMFIATFLVSIVWIALFSYLMVWMVTLIGYTFGISDAIMGITLLAAGKLLGLLDNLLDRLNTILYPNSLQGTSVPDAYTSLHVAKMGQGDMAVSNSIGSNVFDILVGLALPFFIETAVIYPGTNASINSKGLFYAMILLFLSLLITIYLFYINQWVLDKKLGIMMIIAYFVILLFCTIFEFNIINVKNPVLCDD